MLVEIGKQYRVNHRRKGRFDVTVKAIDEEWVTVVIDDGRASALSHSGWLPGDEVSLRRRLTTFTPIVPPGRTDPTET